MDLQPVTLRHGQRLLCCKCQQWAGDQYYNRTYGSPPPAPEAVYADLDGTPFKSYYCTPCAAKARIEDSVPAEDEWARSERELRERKRKEQPFGPIYTGD